MAAAKEIDVLNLWQGLGYYSRARNLHFTAKYISQWLKGVFPNNYNDLKKLKGIGDYTASAIASFAFGEAVATLDGNVYRVLARYFDIDTPINSAKGARLFKQLADQILDKSKSHLHNQAIMEFGALQCKPKKIDCDKCPLNRSCLARAKDKTTILPVKLKKVKMKNKYFNFFLILDKDQFIFINERKGKGIWEGLYDFPAFYSDTNQSDAHVLNCDVLQQVKQKASVTVEKFNLTPWLHKLTHLNIYATFWVVHTDKSVMLEAYKRVDWKHIQDYPLPRLIENFVKEFSQ